MTPVVSAEGGFGVVSLEPCVVVGFVAVVVSDLKVKAGSVGRRNTWRTPMFRIVTFSAPGLSELDTCCNGAHPGPALPQHMFHSSL